MTPHPVVPRADHYRHLAYNAAVVHKTLASLPVDAPACVRECLLSKLADALGRLDRMHGQVTGCLR